MGGVNCEDQVRGLENNGLRVVLLVCTVRVSFLGVQGLYIG